MIEKRLQKDQVGTLSLIGSKGNASPCDFVSQNPSVPSILNNAEIMSAVVQDYLGLNPLPPKQEALNIQPLLQHHYSDCVTHLINHVPNFGSQNPVIASSMPLDFTGTRRYEKAFLGVRSFKCLLTILHVHQSFPSANAFSSALNFILPQKSASASSFQIYPQTVIVLTPLSQLSKLSNHVLTAIKLHNNLYFLPEIFILGHIASSGVGSSSIRGHFICWYCGRGPTDHRHVQSLEFACAGSTDTCKTEMAQVVEANVVNGAAPMWNSMYPFRTLSSKQMTRHANPFDRVRPSSVADAVASFVLDFNGTWYNRETWVSVFPHFVEATPEILSESENRFKLTLLQTGMTPRIKFITQSKVWSPKSSYTVYFTPFTWLLWVALLLAAVFIHLIMRVSRFTLSFGGYDFTSMRKSTGVPASMAVRTQKPSFLSSRMEFGTWLLATATILNVYQAAFSSEFTLTFPFVTSWRHLTELDNFTFYLLVSNYSCGRFMHKRKDQAIIETTQCTENTLLFPECRIVNMLGLLGEHEGKYHRNADLEHWLRGLRSNLYLLCNSEENMEKRSYERKARAAGMAFLTYDYEFQHNWEKINKIMHTNSEFKYANNLNVDDDFGVTFTGYMFTDGLHKRFSQEVIGRFKMLISAGIYAFWEKWDRIRFSQSGLQIKRRVRRYEAPLPKPLSFYNSGTAWLFGAQIVAWLGAIFVFVTETISSCFIQKSGSLLRGKRLK